jgi:hypothetical protein
MRSFLLLFSSGVLVLAAACGGKTVGTIGPGGTGSGSSGGNSSGSGSGANSCFESSGVSQACISCIETQCASQLGAAESGCSDLLSCECPGGIYSATAAEACAAKAQESSCPDATSVLDQCEEQFCVNACETSSGGGSSSGSSSGGVGSSSSGGSSSSSGGVPTGCTVDDTVDCSGGASGYACAVGDNPESEDPALSCSTPTSAAGEDDFCCFLWTFGGAQCVPDDELTAVCPDPTSYGYQCDSGDDPSSLSSALNCSAPVPDPDGVHDDFCCVYE